MSLMGKQIRIALIITVMVVTGCTGLVGCIRPVMNSKNWHQSDEPIGLCSRPEVEELIIERITCTSDQDGDGLNDLDDIVEVSKDVRTNLCQMLIMRGLPS